jgi:hypothetical protein
MLCNGFSNGYYDFLAYRRSPENSPMYYDYITGIRLDGGNIKNDFIISAGSIDQFGLNHDKSEVTSMAYGVYGFGKYKLEFWWGDNIGEPDDTCTFEQDYDLNAPDTWFGFKNDGPAGPRVEFKIENAGTYRKISDVNRQIKTWEHRPVPREKIYGPPSGYFLYDNSIGYNYPWIPLDARRDCYQPPRPDQRNQNFYDDKQNGNLTLNLMIKKDVYTPNSLFGLMPLVMSKPLFINIHSGAKLKLSNSAKLTLNTNTDVGIEGSPSFIFTIMDGTLILDPYSNIIVNNDTKIIFHCFSNLVMNTDYSQNSKIYLVNGGQFCNLGMHVTGILVIEIQGIRNGWQCPIINCPDNIINDSSIVTLSDSASLEIPDNITLYFQDPTTVLKMNPNSEIKMGYNSKLVFSDGARLIADHATFTSLYAGGSWDGIYLEDISNDTLTNCTIENAINGVNIVDKSSAGIVQPSTEISNCTFANYTGSAVPNALYISNSNNVLVRNCTFVSDIDNGFETGILIQYCPSGYLNIIDNELEKCETGIAVVQSSPYIARNTITNNSSHDNGIFLDNANGTIEYNIITGYYRSLLGYYTSPYVLKNIFDSPLNINFDVYSNSVPVLRPLNSGTTLSWLGGNNTFTGNADSSALHFKDNSYLETDSGYNVISQPYTEFYVVGSLPAEYNEMLTTYNYWGEETPTPGKFNVTGGEVIFEPYLDNGEPPQTTGYDLNSIGFDLYDTVYTQSLGGDNPSAEKLFMQAYRKEVSGDYVNAISLYKQVVTNYKNTSYSAIALTRAFNCYEKKRSNLTEFQNFSVYLGQVFNNNTFPVKLRKLAEDFVIKTKVRRYLLNDAINDYTNMYQQNQNNSQGIHALLNKQCLLAMLHDTLDNPGSNTYSIIAQRKKEIINLLNNPKSQLNNVISNIIPKQYRLYQNYPNPFNPVTTIKYDLPFEGIVKITVYDITGKVVYSNYELKTAGTYSFLFNGINLSSGVYFYKIEAGQFTDVKRMVLIK